VSSQTWHKEVVSRIGKELKSEGFKRGSNNHIRDLGEITNIVGFQRSTSTTPSHLKFTVNIGVNCKLLDELANRPTSTSAVGSHIQRRLNEFVHLRGDKWWHIAGEDQIDSVCREILDLLRQYVLPKLNTIRSCRDLLRIWDEGQNRVLTSMFKVDQEHYHDVLKEALEGQQ
jgi:hypothetical protein